VNRRNEKQWLSNFRLLGRFSTIWKSFVTGVGLNSSLLTKQICTMTNHQFGGNIESSKETLKTEISR
jgi:hypothetical protein